MQRIHTRPVVKHINRNAVWVKTDFKQNQETIKVITNYDKLLSQLSGDSLAENFIPGENIKYIGLFDPANVTVAGKGFHVCTSFHDFYENLSRPRVSNFM